MMGKVKFPMDEIGCMLQGAITTDRCRKTESLSFFSAKAMKVSCFFLRISILFVYLHSEMVRWMSGLVTGLQNRLQRFESASDLRTLPKGSVFC